MNERFESMTAFLLEAEISCLNTMTFDELCSLFGSSPRQMNRCFYDALGMSGEEFISRLCS